MRNWHTLLPLCQFCCIISGRRTKQMDQQTYITTLEVNVIHTKDDFGYTLNADEYGTVTISHMVGMEAMTGTTNHIHIPKDGIQHIIDALVKFQ